MSRYDPSRHHRRSIRLKGYDYTRPGAYFVTLCTHQRAHLFGRVVDGEMQPNVFGKIVQEEWFRTAEIRRNVVLHADEFVVMPNHIHGIIWIVEDSNDRDNSRGDLPVAPTTVAPTTVAPTEKPIAPHQGQGDRLVAPRERPRGPAPGSLGAIMAGFKSAATKRINQIRGTPGVPVWQRNYYEHIIRTQRALRAIQRYIIYNPLRWQMDRYNAAAVASDPWAADLRRLLQSPLSSTSKEDTPR